MHNKQKISLVITAYHIDKDMAAMTKKCLNSIDEKSIDEIILVDDASPYFLPTPNVKQIIRTENGGFPECANTGFKHATGDIIILSNNDIVFTKGWLEAILEPLKQGYDISSIKVSDSDGYETENIITEDDWFGSLWAMRREVYDTIGGFDERFKGGNFEDKDYWIRAKEAGFKIGKNHAVVVEHIGRGTMSKVYENQENFHENAQRFKDKYGYLL